MKSVESVFFIVSTNAQTGKKTFVWSNSIFFVDYNTVVCSYSARQRVGTFFISKNYIIAFFCQKPAKSYTVVIYTINQ